ncbi:MAG: enoyl-CoA hydratase/isomerase family protein, partial [Nitrospinae bacterium]|nr:enoyl-CoA hydratase/isomerase family protein [Nitrospinota bacterium]
MPDYSRYETLKIDITEQVATITLHRPEVLNAVNPLMHRELEELFGEIGSDDHIHAIVLTGAGRAFCAGGDVKGMDQRVREGTPRVPLRGARRLIQNMLEVEQPLIAGVNGDAVGLGATIALFCNIIIAAENARIGDTHVKVGLVAGDGGAVIWPLLVGIAKAKELLFTGDLITAQEAERIGLINRVVPRGEAYEEALTLANRLAAGPTRAIRW